MDIRNRDSHWGLVSILLHWLSAVVILALFTLGIYMTGLTYYDPWYHQAPHIHKSTGLLLLLLTLVRLAWLGLAGSPLPVANQPPIQVKLATWVHRMMYLLILMVAGSGYLISTAKGDPIQVFDWFSIGSLVSRGEVQSELAGQVHLVLAYALIVVACGHALVALKHHFIDRDSTLARILVPRRRSTQ